MHCKNLTKGSKWVGIALFKNFLKNYLSENTFNEGRLSQRNSILVKKNLVHQVSKQVKYTYFYYLGKINLLFRT